MLIDLRSWVLASSALALVARCACDIANEDTLLRRSLYPSDCTLRIQFIAGGWRVRSDGTRCAEMQLQPATDLCLPLDIAEAMGVKVTEVPLEVSPVKHIPHAK